MDPAPLALMLSRDALLREVNSARPWAPVVEPDEPHGPRWRRLRAAIATVLRWAAEAVAPAPAHRVASPAH